MHPTIAHGLVLQRHAELRREADDVRLIRAARDGSRQAAHARAAHAAASRLVPGRGVAEQRAVACEDGAC